MTELEMPKYGLATLEINGRGLFTFSANSELKEYKRMLRRYKSWDSRKFVPGDALFSIILGYLKPTFWDGKAPIKVRKATHLEENKWRKSITKAKDETPDDAWEHDWNVVLQPRKFGKRAKRH
jgi:hypothetical protein